jgi:basic membrane lipoprotein Med (substrate-binding protein (PBP1-ABC) superfamily)/DNA-binding SARP family transcriptional activator
LDEDRAIAVGGRKHQVLLVLLLLNANRVISTDRLLDELWGDDAPGKENALWVYISRLRSTLGGRDLLVTHDHGYSLTVDPSDVDAHQFEAMVSEGRTLVRDDPAAASQLLGDALALWRGPALEEFAYDDFAQAEIVRLEELRSLAHEDRIEADLQRGRSGELIGELEAMHRAHPNRERVIGQLMLALYRAGRQTDALQVFERFRVQLRDELGLEPSAELRRLEEQILLHDSRLHPRRRDAGSADVEGPVPGRTNPFKGLRAFSEDDSADFFGRDRIVAETVRRLNTGAELIGLVGPSGSGKSSIVRAGLIPAIRKGAIEGSDAWQIAQMVPGSRPFAELEAALLRSSLDAPDSLSEQLADRETGVLRAVLRVLPTDTARLLLVIDQFEELFITVQHEDDRALFLSGLLNAIDDSHGRVNVVLTLRADFYDRPLAYPEFGSRLGDGIINVVPLRSNELEMAAQQPAERTGVTLEPALVAALLTDVIGRPGALPLFQYALTELFDRRVDDTLSVAEYEALGGVSGVLSRRADDLLAQLDDDQQLAAQQLFLRLVSIADTDEWTRRRVHASEVLSLDVDVLSLQMAIDAFASSRLLVLDRDVVSDAPTVEVAHEALLTNWSRLSGWIEAARDDVRRHVSLGAAMTEWSLADGNPDYLLSGARLDSYAQWAQTATMQLTTDERHFLDASLRYQKQVVEEQHRRQAIGAKVERSARRRLWAVTAVIVAVAIGAGLFVFGVFDPGQGPTVAFFGVRDDGGWGSNIAAGLDRAAQSTDLVLVDAPPVVDPSAEFRELAETGPDIIISDALPTFMAADVFTEFPAIKFGIVDGYIDAPNTTGVEFNNEEGAFLAGVAAATKTTTGVVGFVGGLAPVVSEFQAGFEAGAHWVDPDVRVLATYIVQQFVDETEWLPFNAFGRPDLGAARAAALFERGADVVFHAAGASGMGTFDAAVEQSSATGRKLWAIGVDNDQWFDVGVAQQAHVLTSVIKRGDVAAQLLVDRLLRDESPVGIVRVGLADGVFSYSTQGIGLTGALVAALERAKVGIVEGRIVVPTEPTGPVLDLDPIQNAFEAALSDLTPQQIKDFLHGWLATSYPEVDSVCSFESVADSDESACADLVITHVDEYLALQ